VKIRKIKAWLLFQLKIFRVDDGEIKNYLKLKKEE